MKESKDLILIVDDNPANLKVVAAVIDQMNCEYIFALSGEEAMESLSVDQPDLILLDVMMPDMNGYEVCTKIKATQNLKDIPIIFLTANSEIEHIIKGFEVGGADYITKPFNALELKARVETHLKLKHTTDLLKKANQELLRVSITDPLTSLYNRRFIMMRLEQELQRHKRYLGHCSIMLIDIDFFKKVNDQYGHDCGDLVLKHLSSTMLSCLREQDTVSRWGGEEFLILTPETDLDGSSILAERIRKSVEKSVTVYKNKEIKITLTIGITDYKQEDTVDMIIKRADEALFEGKEQGRNRVIAKL